MMSIIFPLITFPYVTRILAPGQIGEYDYANSIINYFILIAGLGITTYAIRNGASIRNDRKKFENFCSEVFTLNIFSTVISYILLFVCMFLLKPLYEYKISIMLFSVSILFKTLGVEWILDIFEEYKYTTIRSILFQFISLILLFSFVKNENDLYKYILINIFSNVGANIWNFIHAKKNTDLRIIFNKRIFSHLKSVFIIFSTTLATVIYINSDISMLGYICGTEEVGYYSVASKMYNCIKAMLNGMIAVFMTRLSVLYHSEPVRYRETFKYAFDLITLITIPLAIGAMLYSSEIILLLSGEGYLKAEQPMILLFFSLIFATLGNLYSSGGLLQAGKEKFMLITTGAGAVLNVILNYFLIPYFRVTGASIATLITELIICSALFISFYMFVGIKIDINHIIKCFVATVPFYFVKIVTIKNGMVSILYQLVGILICIVIYFISLIILKNKFLVGLLKLRKNYVDR